MSEHLDLQLVASFGCCLLQVVFKFEFELI